MHKKKISSSNADQKNDGAKGGKKKEKSQKTSTKPDNKTLKSEININNTIETVNVGRMAHFGYGDLKQPNHQNEENSGGKTSSKNTLRRDNYEITAHSQALGSDFKNKKEDDQKVLEQLEEQIRDAKDKKEKTLLMIRKIKVQIKIEFFQQAQTTSCNLQKLLQSTDWANEKIDQSSLDDWNGSIREILDKTKHLKKNDISLELTCCRFYILKQFNNEKLYKLGSLGKDLYAFARSMSGSNQKDKFKLRYGLMDDILREMQNIKCTADTPKDKSDGAVDYERKCNQVVYFLMQYGNCCAAIKDFEEAIDRNKRALNILEFVFGDEAAQQKTYGHCHNNIGYAQEHLKQMKEAASFYKKAGDAYKEVPNWDEKEKSKAISEAQTSYDRVSSKK